MQCQLCNIKEKTIETKNQIANLSSPPLLAVLAFHQGRKTLCFVTHFIYYLRIVNILYDLSDLKSSLSCHCAH